MVFFLFPTNFYTSNLKSVLCEGLFWVLLIFIFIKVGQKQSLERFVGR